MILVSSTLLLRYMGKLSVGTMIMGHDDMDGFSIYYVDNEGLRSKGKLFAVGSGSTYAYRYAPEPLSARTPCPGAVYKWHRVNSGQHGTTGRPHPLILREGLTLTCRGSWCSILDAGYRADLTVEEAKLLGIRAIRHATYRDAFSGGFINVYLIRKDGWERIARVDSGYLELSEVDAPGGKAAERRGEERPPS
jgi:20S proteasome subunit beta 5